MKSSGVRVRNESDEISVADEKLFTNQLETKEN